MTHPIGWQEFKLKDILQISSKKYDPQKNKTNYKCIELEHIDCDTGILKGFINSNEQLSIKNVFENGDVLYGKLRPYLRKFYNAKFDGVCSSEIWVLKGKKVINQFLYYFIQSYNFNYIANISCGTKMPRADWNYMSEIEFVIPPLDEQKRIAEILSVCDDYIENLSKLIEKKEQYKKGVMQKVLSGEVRFKGFKDEWQTVRLGDILLYEQPNNYIVKNDEYNDKYECPVLTAGKTFILGYTNEKIGIYNKIPVIIFDDFTTETKYVNFPFKVKSSAIKILSPNKCNLKLVYELIKMIKFNAESHKRYWISEYQYLEIKIPKSIEEQKKIASLLNAIDEDIDNLKKDLELRKQQKKGLMQKLLTGEVRV